MRHRATSKPCADCGRRDRRNVDAMNPDAYINNVIFDRPLAPGEALCRACYYDRIPTEDDQ